LSGRFVKGESGNLNGRPRARRPNVSAFDIIFDKTLTVTQNGVERELTVDEALELQTYQAAIKGSRLAERQVLKMIAKREVALAKRVPSIRPRPIQTRFEPDPRNVDAVMLLLGIAVRDPSWKGPCEYGVRMKLATWAAQAGLSRPGRKALTDREVEDVNRQTMAPDKLKWPRRFAHG
jgi:hypothetical protein